MTSTSIGTAQRLITTLNEHLIDAEHIETREGAAVDLHVLQLAGGVKVSRVVNLARDLAVAIGVDEVRIQAPIPGTPYIGIEAPAAERATLDYADMTRASALHGNALPFPVGQQVGNGNIWGDLAKLPHLLIAGTTGSGKSVAVNALLTSIIDHRDASEVRIHLIDPKRVELVPFAGAPQVDTFATDVEDGIDLLADLLAEMDRRYNLFQGAGVRNLEEYNDLVTWAPHPLHPEPILPRHVLVIDELADLMAANQAVVEPAIARLGAVARAAGIHMVLATQRPSVKVVTGVIKANVPSRWVFTVASGVDSKVALDATGAEKLYGAGDSLWSPVGSTKPLRVQGVWTSADEVTRAVEASIERHRDQEILPSLLLDAAEDDDDVEIEGLPEGDLSTDDTATLELIRSDHGYDPMEDAVREDLRGLELPDSPNAPGVRTVLPFRNPRVRDRSDRWLESAAALGLPINPEPDPFEQGVIESLRRETDASAKTQRTAQWRNLAICWASGTVVVVEVIRLFS